MKLKTKLTLGLGFLFLIIFTLILFCMDYIGKISNDSKNILKNNYNSVLYAQNMSSALDRMNISLNEFILYKNDISFQFESLKQDFDSAKTLFDKNLLLEKGNITEENEKGYLDDLYKSYNNFLAISAIIKSEDFLIPNDLNSTYISCRKLIENIADVNMKAIYQKNQFADNDAEKKKIYMAVLGSICLLLAFFYFWYFPLFVSTSISYLAEKITDLLKKARIESNINTKDESFVILKSIELLEKKMNL